MTSLAILFGILGLAVGLISMWFTTEALKRMDQIQGVKPAAKVKADPEVARLENLTRTLAHRLGKLEMTAASGSNPAPGKNAEGLVMIKNGQPDRSFTPSTARSA